MRPGTATADPAIPHHRGRVPLARGLGLPRAARSARPAGTRLSPGRPAPLAIVAALRSRARPVLDGRGRPGSSRGADAALDLSAVPPVRVGLDRTRRPPGRHERLPDVRRRASRARSSTTPPSSYSRHRRRCCDAAAIRRDGMRRPTTWLRSSRGSAGRSTGAPRASRTSSAHRRWPSTRRSCATSWRRTGGVTRSRTRIEPMGAAGPRGTASPP